MNKVKKNQLSTEMVAYRRAAIICPSARSLPYDNPLLKRPLKREHIKPALLGHRERLTRNDWSIALAHTVRDRLLDRWIKGQRRKGMQ
jgi:phosphoketolase